MAFSQYGNDAPEVIEHTCPEVAPQQPTTAASYTLASAQPPTTAGGYTLASSDQYSPQKPPNAAAYYSSQIPQVPPKDGVKKVGRGCTRLVFILSAIIAILAAAVIGLAVGTGVEANRAKKAESSLAALNDTQSAAIDNRCSKQPDNVTGTTYTAFGLLGQTTFTMHCNKDTSGDPLLSLFVANFNTCMDACSAYSMYEPAVLSSNNKNATCAGVSFIPLWTNKVNATRGNAPGNCYLKAGPQAAKSLTTPDIGTDVHAAITSNS